MTTTDTTATTNAVTPATVITETGATTETTGKHLLLPDPANFKVTLLFLSH